MKLVEFVYRDTETFPREEMYGLTRQIKSSAISVPSNIAEGSGRNFTGELIQFLGITCGSIAELETQLELAVRLGFMQADSRCVSQADRVARLVRALRKSLQERSRKAE